LADPLPIPTGIELTSLDRRFREDPYPVLATLRAHDPVHRDEVFGRYVLTRHDDVVAILRNRELWSDPRKGNPGSFAYEVLKESDEEPSMLLMDDPGHRRLRDLVKRSFTPRAIERWRGRVREVAVKVIGALDEGEFDLIEEVAGPIPTVVIAEILGVDPGMHENFKRWSDASILVAFSPVKTPAAVAAAEQAGSALDAFFRTEIEARRSKPGNDLISELVLAETAGDGLSETEIVSMCNLLLLAGNLTTTDLIGNGVKALLDHPGELAKLRERPDLMPSAVEELLRYDSAVVSSGRIAHRDQEIGGVKISEGETMDVMLAAANRDPAVYPDPDLFDIEREDTHHQAFGGGRHICLGAHLARLEAQETLAALLSRFSSIGQGQRGYEYASNPGFRGFEQLWVSAERSS
jgi:hypothetical protein